MDVLGRRLF